MACVLACMARGGVGAIKRPAPPCFFMKYFLTELPAVSLEKHPGLELIPYANYGGTAYAVFTVDNDALAAQLKGLPSVDEISKEAYDERLKKKAGQLPRSPKLKAPSQEAGKIVEAVAVLAEAAKVEKPANESETTEDLLEKNLGVIEDM